MPPTTTTERLADYEQRYRELAAQLATIGLIHSGSVTRRYTRCATPGCKCHAEPPQPHGPYYQWTAKNNGKTVTRRLTENEAKLYQEWIANDRQLRQPIQQMQPNRGQSRRAETQTSSQPITEHASPQHAHRQTGLDSPTAHKTPEQRAFPGSPRILRPNLRLV